MEEDRMHDLMYEGGNVIFELPFGKIEVGGVKSCESGDWSSIRVG